MVNYPVIIGNHALSELKQFLENEKFSAIAVLTDNNTQRHCLPLLMDKIPALNSSVFINIPAGDINKNIKSCELIFSHLLLHNTDRNSLLLNVGGGMVSDIGGFAASVFKRGINYINLPTTLLSMVDASIGGKTAVNLAFTKNAVGTFSNPAGVFIYPDFLKTLPSRELHSAYAEIIKHILLSDAEMWSLLKRNVQVFFAKDNLLTLIKHSVSFKNSIVKKDPHDKNIRRTLNFGHTFGHAIEGFSMTTEYPLTHGESIAAGIIGELHLSMQMFNLPENEIDDAIIVIRNIYPNLSLEFSSDKIFSYMKADKKNNGSSIGFSLIESPGRPSALVFPTEEMVLKSLEFTLNAINKATY